MFLFFFKFACSPSLWAFVPVVLSLQPHFVSLSGRCSALIQDNEIPAGCLHNEPPRYQPG